MLKNKQLFTLIMGNRKLNFTLTPKTWTPTNSNCFPFPFRVSLTGVLMYYLPKQSIRCMLYIHIHGPFMVYMYVPIPHKLLQHDADRFVVDTNHKKYPRIAVLFSKVTVPTPTQFQTDVRWCQIWISLKGKETKTAWTLLHKWLKFTILLILKKIQHLLLLMTIIGCSAIQNGT